MADSTNLQECEKLLDDIKPSNLRRHQIQYYGISDIGFGKEYITNVFNEKSNQAIALYALSGKFQIYYVLDRFKLNKIDENRIEIFPTQIKAYVDDSFDFIIEKPEDANQFVGSWNYEDMEFIVIDSIWQGYINDKAVDLANNSLSIKMSKNTSKDLKGVVMRNQDYNNTQNYFNLGCDFRILTSSFKDIEVHPLSMPISVRIDENV